MTLDKKSQITGARIFMEMQRDYGRESLSGPGSTLGATREVRKWLADALERLYCTHVADVPCGDYHWMGFTPLKCQYSGYDCLPELIKENHRTYAREGVRFAVLDCVREVPEHCDVVLCRDLLVHLTLQDALQVIENFRKSGAKFLMVTTFPDVTLNPELSQSHEGWGWRMLNMEIEPFNLGKPVDECKEVEPGKRLRVYKL